MQGLRWLLPLVLTSILGACGDNTPYQPPPTEPPPTPADYRTPQGFSRRDCVAGAMAGQATPGIYQGRFEADGFASDITMRIDQHGQGELFAEQNGRHVQTIEATDDYVFTLRENGSYQTAMFYCRVDATNTWRGQIAFIFGGEDGQEPGVLLGTTKLGRLTPVDDQPAQGLALLGEFLPSTWTDISVNVRVRDGLAYMANYTRGLDIVDVTVPSAPFQVGHAPTKANGEIYNDVKLYDGPGGHRYAIMGGSHSGAVVYDVTIPATPTEVATMGEPAQFGEGTDIHTLFVDGQRAYLANTRRGLEIYDLTDPTAPIKLGEFRVATNDHYLHDLFVEGDRAYLNYWNNGMVIVDVGNPAAPSQIGVFKDYGETTNHSAWVTTIGERRIAITGDEQYGAHAHIVDVTEGTPAFLSELSQWQTRPEVSIHNIMAFGSTVFISHYQDGVRVLDLSVPDAPTLVAWFQTWPGYPTSSGESFFDGAVGIDYDPLTQRVYVADATRGLIILAFDAPPTAR